MIRMGTLALALLLLTGTADVDAAQADRAQLPQADWPYTYYVTTATAPGEAREDLASALQFVMPSLSSRSYLEGQLPVKVTGTLYRIDTRALGWEKTLPQVLCTHYPYRAIGQRPGSVPLVFDGLWFVATITDPVETGNAQQLLLYGRELKDAGDFRKFWKVQEDAQLNFGLIEGQSGVSVQRTRLIENNASGNRGYHWQTFDSRVVAGETDPLETLNKRPPKHDASELIAGIPKQYAGKGGTLQAYFLADGAGKPQVKAPADIVTDSTGVRGVEIRNTISCIACHVEGIRHPTVDQYRAYILSAARVYADKHTHLELDRYHASDIAKEIRRANEDYAAGVKLCNGLTPEENAAAFIQCVQLYDGPVDLAQAARELHIPQAELRLAIGDYSRRYGLTGRLAFLVQGDAISRQQWQANFTKAQEIVQTWYAR